MTTMLADYCCYLLAIFHMATLIRWLRHHRWLPFMMGTNARFCLCPRLPLAVRCLGACSRVVAVIGMSACVCSRLGSKVDFAWR
jgi:hypothetical protein